jgi:RNA polymerase sigma-70 factor (ECF subfamily)
VVKNKTDYEAKYEAKTDEQLMELYQKGDGDAFELIYQRFASRILGFLKKKTGSGRQAQDLTQEVFLKLHRSREQYNKMLPLAPWIFSISRSVFLDFAKKKSIEDSTAPEEFDHLQAPRFDPGAHDLSEKSTEALASLPEPQRQVVNLRVLDEATFDEIAEKLSTSPDNARQLLSRGLKKLKTSFAGKE